MPIGDKNKKVLLFVGILALLILLYFMFFGSSSTPSNVTAGGLVTDGSVAPADSIIGKDLLVKLNKLEQIKLDDTIFQNPAFTSLVDQSRPLEQQPLGKTVGRRNPFIDFNLGSSTSVSTNTIDAGAIGSGNQSASVVKSGTKTKVPVKKKK